LVHVQTPTNRFAIASNTSFDAGMSTSRGEAVSIGDSVVIVISESISNLTTNKDIITYNKKSFYYIMEEEQRMFNISN